MTAGDPRADVAAVEEVPALVAKGAALYNAGAYWDAHESWERAWHALKAAGRPDEAGFVHALILMTAAFENLRRGKPDGFRSQLGKSLESLRTHRHAARAAGVAGEVFLVAALEVLKQAAQDRADLASVDGLPFPPPPVNLLPRAGGPKGP